ncbi:MAG: hypothetical protein WB785_00025 [Mycobacterium sp.]|uniref:hypothetical protein n=1 Tax=Mycobacterium sp. TaxID=1785 RepID=UPI003C5A2631
MPGPTGVARFVGTVPNDHEIFGVIYPDDLELYHLDPPLCGYRIVAAAQSIYAMHARLLGDPDPPLPEDPVSTYLYGTTGGEGLQIVWKDELLKADGKIPARALAEAGYQVRRPVN